MEVASPSALSSVAKKSRYEATTQLDVNLVYLVL
jgi:hypothetical protein